MTTEISARIVVGLDGSDPSLAALRQARLAGGRVEAVTARHYPVAEG